LQWSSDSLLRIGRQESFEVVLSDRTVGKRHAEVAATTRGWIIRDLGSPGGTFVNGFRLSSGERHLVLNDVLQIGNLSLQVTTLEPSEPRLARPEPVETPPPAEPDAQIKTSGEFVKVKAVSRRSWEKALEAVALHAERPEQQDGHLNTLLRTGYHLCQIASLDELLDSILDDAVTALRAKRASIILANPTTGALQLRRVAVAKVGSEGARCYSKTLAERSFLQGQSMLCQDVKKDADLLTAMSVAHGSMASIICAVLRSPRKRLGVLHLDRGPLQEPFTQEEFYLADAIAANVSVGIESAQLVEQERDQFIQTVTALARTVELRDEYTANHTLRVTDYALMIADALGVSAAERHRIEIGTPLHDIGKIGIPDSVLLKEGPLTADEFEIMKSHTVKGAAILETVLALRPLVPIVRHHHERFDGNGYPDGLAGEEIASEARIVAVADAFDAMTSNRPYRPALSPDIAFAELLNKAGTHFDPDIARAFVELRSRVEAKMGSDPGEPRHTELVGAPLVAHALDGSMAEFVLPGAK
jgi:putative nucleotidyltransferase with HDIG domain